MTKSPAEATPDSDSASTAGIQRISSTLAQTVTADYAESRPPASLRRSRVTKQPQSTKYHQRGDLHGEFQREVLFYDNPLSRLHQHHLGLAGLSGDPRSEKATFPFSSHGSRYGGGGCMRAIGLPSHGNGVGRLWNGKSRRKRRFS